MRVLLIYQLFGPYHRARWLHFRKQCIGTGWDPIGLQLFSGQDLYNWRPANSGLGSIKDLSLNTNGSDNIRWFDVPRLLRTLELLHPDVVIINGWGTRDSLFIHFSCRLRGVQRVVVSDSQEVDFDRSAVKERIKKFILKGVGSAFVAGGPQRRYVQKLGVPLHKITLGCDVVDNDHFKPAQALRRPGGYRLLTVARLAEQKNLIAAGKAYLRFVSGRPKSEAWSWSVAGYGPQECEMARLAATSDGRICLLGPVDYEDLPATYAAADLYWQPSRWEPWGLVVNEAMASGLPVLVSARCGCQEDLVTRETGWTFDPLDDDDMVRALTTAATSHTLWPVMGRAAATHIDDWNLGRFSDGLMEAVRLATQEGAIC